MQGTYKTCLIFGVGAAVLATLFTYSTPAGAIPAWARKYKVGCETCHFGATNRLTVYGRDFQLRGDRTSDDEGLGEIEEYNFANYTSIAGKFRYYADKDSDPSTSFDQEALSIYSGGPLYMGFSYFFEIYLHERGSNATKTGGQDTSATRSKLAEAYVYYNSAPMQENYWFARAGQYTPRLIYAASTGGRVSISRPRAVGDNAGGGNLFTPRDRFYGLAVGFRSATKTMGEFGITNGGGGNARPNQPELNNSKDFFGSFWQQLDDDGSYIGVFGYSGVYPVTGPPAFEDKFQRYGILAAFERDAFEISGGYMTGRHDLSAGGHREPKGWYLEGAYNFSVDWTGYARYDDFDADLTSAPRKKGPAIGISYRLPSIGRMVLEGQETKTDGSATSRQLTFEINWMF